MKTPRTFLIGLTLVMMAFKSYAAAPFCNLRDPSHQIFSMFPQATDYRSIVREVDTNVRSTLSRTMPFSLHNNELGEHTLYVPVADSKPLGVVHVRSESIDWGLAEIVWALDAELNVLDVAFQRCRGRACKTLLDKGFAKVLIGNSSLQLTQMLDGDELEIRANDLGLSEQETQLANTLIQSAIKTIAITETAWPGTVATIQSE